MTLTQQVAPAAEPRAPQRRRWRSVLGPAGDAAAIVFLLVVLMAVFAPLLAPHDPNQVDILSLNQGPSPAHPLGTDASGRDLLSRLIVGSRTTLLGALFVAVLVGFLGTSLGLIAGWFGGVVDTVVSRVLDLLFAFPGILLAFVIVAIFPRSLFTASVAMAISASPFLARIARGEVIRLRSLPFVQALVIQGLGTWRLWARHILPNMAALIIAQITIIFGFSMVGLATLSYLGLGTQPPTADWGRMISDGQSQIQQGHPQESLYASLMIAVTVVSVTVIGDRLTARISRENR